MDWLEILKYVSPAFIFGIIYYAGYFANQIKNNKKEIDGLGRRIDQTNERIDQTNKRLDKTNENLSIVKFIVHKIEGFLMGHKSELAEYKSPIHLVEKGRQFSKYLKIQEIIDRNWDSILERLSAKKITGGSNPYDIERACFDIGERYTKLTTHDELENIKRHAFENGYIISDYDIIFSVLICNKYFDEKGLTIPNK